MDYVTRAKAMQSVLEHYQDSLIEGLYYWLVRMRHLMFDELIQASASPVVALAAPLKLVARTMSFGVQAFDLEQPGWFTPNKIIIETPIARLRDFSIEPNDRASIPVLILPFQSGQHSKSVDYGNGQSQVQMFLQQGFRRVYVMEWLTATHDTKDFGIDTYIAVVHQCIEQIGGPVNLIGNCQGGWLAAIYAALYPQDMHTLALVGAPIDLEAEEGDIRHYTCLMYELFGPRFYDLLVDIGKGVMTKENVLLGYMMMKPGDVVKPYIDLYAGIENSEVVKRYKKYLSWVMLGQDIPGAFYRWMVNELFVSNNLPKGLLTVQDRVVDLKNITCPLYLLTGEYDHITPKGQVLAAADYVSTPASDILKMIYCGGHMGLFFSHDSIANQWVHLANDMLKRSEKSRRPA